MNSEVKNVSQENSGKLDRIIMLLDGDGPNTPGLTARVNEYWKILNGNGNLGLIQKVSIMWRAHVWVMCTLSGIIGYLVKAWVK